MGFRLRCFGALNAGKMHKAVRGVKKGIFSLSKQEKQMVGGKERMWAETWAGQGNQIGTGELWTHWFCF